MTPAPPACLPVRLGVSGVPLRPPAGGSAAHLAIPRSSERPQRAVLSVHHGADSTWRILASAAQATCSQG